MSMTISSKSRGIYPSDIVLKSVIAEGFKEIRRNPFLLDDIFRPFLEDDETAVIYGKAQVKGAKEWFLSTDVPVKIADVPEPPTGTSVVIQLADSHETEETLADVNYDPTDAYDREWPVLAGPISPASYDPVTGLLVLPPSFTLVAVDGMIVLDRQGVEHPILAVPQSQVLQIEKSVNTDMSSLTIRGARPAQGIALESVEEEETYQIGVHAAAEQQYLSYLYAIVKYVLYRSRQELERRGMERVRYSSSGPERNGNYGTVENVYSRYFTVQANVRQTWTKLVGGKLLAVDTTIEIDMTRDVLGGVSPSSAAGSATIHASGGGSGGSGSGPAVTVSSYKVLVDSQDTNPGYLLSKLVAGSNVSLTRINVGGDEQIRVSASGGGGGGGTIIEISADEEAYVQGANEQVFAQFSVDFDVISNVSMKFVLAGLTKQTGGASGTYMVRVGGTPDVADGTTVCTLTTTHASYPLIPDIVTGSTVPAFTGVQVVKITGNSSTNPTQAAMKAPHVVVLGV